MANAVVHRLLGPTRQGLLAALLLVPAGCQTTRPTMPERVEAQLAAVAPTQPNLGFAPSAVAPLHAADVPIDLSTLWQLAVSNNPSLREAAADVEAARG